jgi:glutamyl-tRNA synthetase
MILRIDDTDLERNTEESLQSIFEGLAWLGPRTGTSSIGSPNGSRCTNQLAAEILAKGLAYRDFTPAEVEERRKAHTGGAWLSNPGQREISREESDPRRRWEKVRAAFSRAARHRRSRYVHDLVYGEQSKSRRYRGLRPAAQQRRAHVSSGFLRRRCGSAHQPHRARAGPPDEHVQAHPDFPRGRRRAAAIRASAAAHRARWQQAFQAHSRARWFRSRLIAMRDFCPQAFINFLCLLGWSPKNDREQMTREELVQAFSFEGVNRSNAVVNFTEEDPFDPKASG